MTSKIIANGILKAVGVIIGICVLLFFLYKIQSVIIYLLIAGFLSLVGRPIMRFLKGKLKFNETLAVIITMILFVIIIFGIIGLFIPLVLEQGENLSLLDINLLQTNIEIIYKEVVDNLGLNTTDIEATIQDSKFMSQLDFNFIPEILNSIITGLGSFSIGLFSVLFILFFFLKDNRLFSKSIVTLFPKSEDERLKRSLAKIKNLLSRYFSGLILQILILFTIYSITLVIFGIENALVIATLCALLNVIPYVGPLISSILIVLLTISSNIGQDFTDVILPKTFYVVLGFIIAQLVDNFFSQPLIFAKSVKSHPLEIFLVIIIFGLLFGIPGLIVAIPMYTALKVVAKEFFNEYRVVKNLTKNI